MTTESDYTEIIEQVLNGMTALFIDKSEQCLLIKGRGFEKRAVSQPVNETVIRGEAVIAAELVNPILIIVVAITGLANLVIPSYPLGFGIRILRFVFVLLGAMAGFYGIAVGIYIFGGLACFMKSFGVPYLSPVAPRAKTFPDIIPRIPTWLQK